MSTKPYFHRESRWEDPAKYVGALSIVNHVINNGEAWTAGGIRQFALNILGTPVFVDYEFNSHLTLYTARWDLFLVEIARTSHIKHRVSFNIAPSRDGSKPLEFNVLYAVLDDDVGEFMKDASIFRMAAEETPYTVAEKMDPTLERFLAIRANW